MEELEKAIELLQNGERLPARFRDHPLKEDKRGLRECHIESDWLLIYKIENDIPVLTLLRTGSHG